MSGGFNINLLNTRDKRVEKLYEITNSYALKPTIELPTRVTTVSATLIDNIFVNSNNFRSDIVVTALSDHYGQEVELDTITRKEEVLHKKKTRTFNQATSSQVREELEGVDWSELLDGHNPALQLERFLYVVQMSITTYCTPKIDSRKNITNRRWVDNEVREKSKIKRLLYEDAKNGLIDWDEYKMYKNNLKILVQQKKKSFYTRKMEESSNKIKTTWTIVNELTGRAQRDSGFLAQIKVVKEDEDDIKILNDFNKYFACICENQGQRTTDLRQVYRNDASMYLINTTPVEIFNIIHSLKNTSSTGPDGIPTKLLKMCADVICTPLSTIINNCFENTTFPEQLKRTNIIPIYKSGPREEYKNYRPIALVPVLSKIFEKTIVERMSNFVQKYNIITDAQNAYLKGRSTIRALYLSLNTILEGINDKKRTAGVFFRPV